jgi:broad specificity phosphatase PhoE
MRRARQTAQTAANAAGIACFPALNDLREVAVGICFDHFFPFVTRLPEAPIPLALKQAMGNGIYNLSSLWCLIRWLQGKTRQGESPDQSRRRVLAVLAALDSMPQSSIAVIGHAFWLFCLARTLAPPLRRRIGWFHHVSVTTVVADGRGRYRLMGLAQ